MAEIANHMKKLLTLSNKDGVDDAKVLRDLEMLSGGLIRLNPEEYRLMDFVEPQNTKTQQTKKKRKK